jgi:hypothetical protein
MSTTTGTPHIVARVIIDALDMERGTSIVLSWSTIPTIHQTDLEVGKMSSWVRCLCSQDAVAGERSS